MARRALAVKIGDIADGRAGLQDENRWNNHLAAFLARYSPDDVDIARPDLLPRLSA